MPARAPAAFVFLFLSSFLFTGAAECGKPAFTPSDVNKLEAAEKRLEVCEWQLSQVLDRLLEHPPRGRWRDHAVVHKLESIAHRFEVVERQVEGTVGPLLERHVENPGPLTGIAPALDRLTARAESFLGGLDRFVELAPQDITPPEAFDVVEDLRDRIPVSFAYLNLNYYRAVIPVRFVEFVEPGDPGVGGDRLRYSLEVTNEVFRRARLRFYVKKNLVIAGTPFTNLFEVDSAGREVLDEDDNRIHMDYGWPADWWSSPLIWPLHWPDEPDCDFVLPPFDILTGQFLDTRYAAQERAGTYCCKEGEIIVYVNYGTSNGGQYPWYTRIIGMSDHHIATRATEKSKAKSKYVVAHEMGHYFGLPHTFPDLKHYGRDYDLARIETAPTEEQPIETIRRWYEPHVNLWDVETDQMAPLSMFWDQVFRPGGLAGGPPDHLFFNSRAEAAAHEGYLQPIIDWTNSFFFRPGQSCCGEVFTAMTAAHWVSAGCRGIEGYYGDCLHPVEHYFTGDPEVQAFTRPASDPDRIWVNVMNYGYPMADAQPRPDDLIEGNFLSESQLEQIDQVMGPDNDPVTRYYPEMTGMRPQLRTCEGCHSQVPGALGRGGRLP